MGFDSSGTFSRTVGTVSGTPIWQADAASGVKIRADRHDSHDQDLANGLTECLTRSGKGVPLVDIPWGGKKIINLQNPAPGSQDAATAYYVDNMPGWPTSKVISGADLNGRLRFSAPSGVNGIEWSNVDMSWLGRPAEALKTSNRLAISNTVDGSGAPANDVFTIDENGYANSRGVLTNNLSYDGSAWRVIAPGIGTRITYASGLFGLASNDAATLTDPYVSTTLRTYFQAQNANGNTLLYLDKSGSGKYNIIQGANAGAARWQMYLGDNNPEGVDRAGSDFLLYSFNNAATISALELSINRLTHLATFGGPVTIPGALTAYTFQSVTTSCILGSSGAGGSVYLRPGGVGSAVGETTVNSAGDMNVSRYIDTHGYAERAGTAPASGNGQFINFDYGTTLHAWVNTADLGSVAFTCDYRLKKDVKPLERTWDKVKALRPISFTRKAWTIHEGEGPGVETRLSVDSDEVEWGFLAHELQDALLPSAASGKKDQEDTVQSPNFPAIIAALTSALQEAMQRIEALEAK